MSHNGSGGVHNGELCAFVGEAALHKAHVGRLYGGVGAELDARARNKGSGRHDYLMLVTGHIPRHRLGEAVHRRCALYGLNEPDELILAAKFHSLNYVAARVERAGIDSAAALSDCATACGAMNSP